MYVITFTNEKGGVGKTANSTHLAATLAMRGRRVLLIDADPQGHSTISFGLKKAPGMYELLVRGQSWKKSLERVPASYYPEEIQNAALVVLPGNIETFSIGDRITDAAILRERLNELTSLFDYVIIDTSPAPSKLQAALFVASDGIIIPTKLETLAFDGLERTIEAVMGANRIRQGYGLNDIALLGCLPTMTRLKTLEHQESLEDLSRFAGDRMFSPITNAIIWAESTRFKQSLFRLNPNGNAVAEINRFCDELLAIVEGEYVS